MVLQIIGYTIISFFAVYGLVQFIFYVWDFSYDLNILRDKVIYTIVGVKNEEDRIEAIARALMWKALKNDTGIADRRLIILDFDSTDKTKEIAKRIAREDGGIKIMERKELLKDIESNL